MITVLSLFDFLVIITDHPLLILRLVWWLQEKNDLLARVQIYEHFPEFFIGFSLIALLVMSIESLEHIIHFFIEHRSRDANF
jgi:hypothetical protein